MRTIVAAAMAVLLAGCAVQPPTYSPRYSAYKPVEKSGPANATHIYVLSVSDSDGKPLEGASVSFSSSVNGNPGSSKGLCATNSSGLCKIEIVVGRDPSYKYTNSYISSVHFTASKDGFYSKTGSAASSYQSDVSSDKSPTVEKSLVLYRPSDYLSPEFLTSKSDAELRERALKFLSAIRLQSMMVDADVMLHGIGTSSFKHKKYFQLKIDTDTTFNSLKLGKYNIAQRLFDDCIRKILGPLNDDIGSPKAFYGYDLIILGHSKSFLEKYATPDKITYRFLIPQSIVKNYKEQNISGQRLLDSSAILMNDERIDLKLQ